MATLRMLLLLNRDIPSSPLPPSPPPPRSRSLKLLLDSGGNPSYQDHEGQSPLFLALCEGKTDCINLLLDFGSSLQTVTKVSSCHLHPYHQLCRYQHEQSPPSSTLYPFAYGEYTCVRAVRTHRATVSVIPCNYCSCTSMPCLG